MRPCGSSEALERRRHRAIDLLKQGHQPVEVAHILGVDRRSVRRWHAAYRAQGLRGLSKKPATGRPAKLDATALKQLDTLLLKGANRNVFSAFFLQAKRKATPKETP